ncbi:MAG: NACHT domain-containing protein [Rhodothermaceae bacterium]|nr:NACHT domain-containing protein [Rhodothermaceae bacterium]
MSNEFIESHKRSHGRRTGDKYEELLFAYWCLRMTVEPEILRVTHEVRGLEPADDVVVEYDTRIKCYQAKHSTGLHSLISLNELTTPPVTGKPPLLSRLSKVWEGLRSKGKQVELHIYTNRAAGPDLGRILDDDQIKESVLGHKEHVALHTQLVNAVSLSSADDISDFLRSLRFNLRQPNVDELKDEIKKDWLRDHLGLKPEEAYDLLMEHVDRWFQEPKSRPIRREEVLEALQIDQTSLLQHFPVNWNTFIPWPNFEKGVIRALNETEQGYTALIGPPGSGKSTFITQLIKRIRKQRVRIIRYYCFTSGDDVNYSTRLSRGEFLKSLIEQLYLECSELESKGGQRYEYSPEKLATLLTYVGKVLKDRGKYLVFIVDGIDHLVRNNPHASDDILNIFPRQLPEGVICLLGCQGPQYFPNFIRRECKGQRTFNLPPFTLSQTHSYLSKHLNNQSPHCLADVLRPIHSKCKGLPLYLRYMAKRLRMDSDRTPKTLVDQFPEYDGNIESYYATLWDELGNDSSIQQLCGLAAQLRFSVKKADLIEMADVSGNFEGARQFRRIEHLLLSKTDGYSLFHESFRIFVSRELGSAIKNDLDSKILQYLKDRIYSQTWFQHAHEYAEKCGDDGYLTENFGWAYVNRAISHGREPEEIVKVLRTAIRAATRRRNFVAVAEISLLVAHTSNRLDYHLDRTDLLKAMTLLGNSETVLGGITGGGENLKLNYQNASLLISMANYGDLERRQSIADDFIDRMDLSAMRQDLSNKAIELIAIYRPGDVAKLVKLFARLSENNRDAVLRRLLRLLYDKRKFGTIRTLKKWLQSLKEWAELSGAWYFWIAQNEYRIRRDTCVHHIIKAGQTTRDPSQNVLLSEMVWKLNGYRQLATSLLAGLNSNRKEIISMDDLVGGLNFGAIRAYVRMLLCLGRGKEVDVLEKYTSTKATMQTLYVRTNIKIIIALENDGNAIKNVLAQLTSERKEAVEESSDVRMAIHHDLPELLHDVFSKYSSSGGNVKQFADELRNRYIGGSIQISNYVLLKALSHVNGANWELKSFLKDEYEIIIDDTLETQARTSELLELTELAAKSGFSGLAKTWLREAIGASRGYGYRKDATLSLLIDALKVAIKRGISDPPSRIAQIADWNLLVAKFTDGTETKWFPRALYDVVLNFNHNLALQLLVAYDEYLPAWQFHDAIKQFIATWEEGATEIAYLCTELIGEHSWENPYANKFKARISLLERVTKKDPENADWIAKQIQVFLLTEVPPDIRSPFIEEFNKVAEKSNLRKIEDASVYTRADLETSSFTLDSTFVIGDKEITMAELPEHLSQSIEVFTSCVHSLEAEKKTYEYREEISDAIGRLLNQASKKSDVKKLYEFVRANEEIESTSRLLIARALLNWGDTDRAKSLCKNVFYDDNKYGTWNPDVESFELLAGLDHEYAIEVLLSFVEQRIQEYAWVGNGIYLLFTRALDRLGDEYTDTIHELYSSYSRFIEHQFESLETDVPSPYQWVRDNPQSRADFETTVLKFVATEWETPALYRRESLMNLVYKVALRQSKLIIPWLIGLLEKNNRTVSEQAAVVLHSIALRNPQLLGDYWNELVSHVEKPHFTQVTHILGCLENLELAPDVKESIRQTLRRIRPTILPDPVMISGGSLRPSPTFRGLAWVRTVPEVVKETVKNVAMTLEMDLNEIQWRIEREMKDMGYDEECSNQKWQLYRDEFTNHGLKTWIPFESYDSHFVWHALNRIVEQRVRASSMDLTSLTGTIGLYDPVNLIVHEKPRPIDISVPHVDESQLRDVPNSIEAWVSFQDEPAIKRTILANEWVSIVDEYDVSAGCASERCNRYPFLASKVISDIILHQRYSPEPNECVVQIGHKPPHFTMTRHTAKELLNRSYDRINNMQVRPVPLVAKHYGWLWSRSQMHTSIAGRWIRQYDLQWKSTESLDLCRNGHVVQRFFEWKDGAKADPYTYHPVGSGARLSVRSDFLERIMDAYNLRLIIVSDRTRRLNSRMGLTSESPK